MQIFRHEAKQLIANTDSKHIIFNIFLKDGWANATRKDVGNRFQRGEATRHLHLPFAITGTVFEKHNIIKRETSCSLKLIAVIQVELEVKYFRLKRMQRGFLENTKWILCVVSMSKPLIAVRKIVVLFEQQATTFSLIVPHYNRPSRSFNASGKFESIVASYIRRMPAFDVFSNSQACVIQGQSTSCAKAQRTFYNQWCMGLELFSV